MTIDTQAICIKKAADDYVLFKRYMGNKFNFRMLDKAYFYRIIGIHNRIKATRMQAKITQNLNVATRPQELYESSAFIKIDT